MLKPKTRMEKSGETQDRFAGRLPNDMTNHLIWKGGKDQESLSGLIPFRAKFECLGLRSPWEIVSLSQYYLHLGSSLLACGQVILCIWRMSSKISGLYPPVDCYTNQPTTTTSLDRRVSRCCKYDPRPKQGINQARDWILQYSQILLDPQLHS